jgi:ABC-2 type transport system permease protein
LIAAGAIGIAAAASTAVQFWFRSQAKRSQFRRRQVSSRLATFAEAFSSIGWAATSALVLVMPIPAAISAALTLAILAATWKFSPTRE